VIDIQIPTNVTLLRKILVSFIRNEVEKVGVHRVVVGLSGGVDSSLSAMLAAEALGPRQVLGIMMPYVSSSPESLAHAETVVRKSSIESLTLEITPQIDAYFARFPDADQKRRGNKMARERMTILYDHSARWNALVLGTSNKTELLLGYGTLYGDMASAINPLGDLYKTQVWALAEAVGVPDVIVQKKPSADLWVGQTDEGELGFTYREVDKLKGTFVDAVQEKLGADNRLRFRIMPTRVISGRPAAKDPNVLALPKHTKLAKRFRAGIRAPEGRLLGSWDFNQIELRVLAGDSGSTFLKHAFEGGLDLHVLTGSEIFGLPPDRAFHDDSLHRLPSKTTNFSIIMGTTGYGLSDQLRGLGYTFPQLQGQSFPDIKSLYRAQAEVCQSWVDRIIDKWEIKPYIDKQHWHARTYGWVADFWGRRRYLPLAASSDKKLRQEALRQAQAFGPQAGARGIYKQGVAAWWTQCYRPLHKMGHYIEPLLDIHDDLLLEFQEDLGPVLLPWVTHILQTTVAWPVPLVVNGKVGQSWVDV